MRRVERIIERVRRETENEEFGTSFGISDEECLDYLNDAQDRIYSEAVKKHARFFQAQSILAAPVNTEELALPAKVYLGNIGLIEYSVTGNERDYYRLQQAAYQERLSSPSGHPFGYIRRNNVVLFVPTPGSSSGYVRISYTKTVPRLDKRRAVISAFTTSGSNITSFVLDTTESIDDENLLKENYLSIVSADGDLKMAAIPFTAIDTTTGVVTYDAGFAFQSGESAAAGDYVVMGAYSTNKADLPTICERYLASHLRMELLDRDANGQGTVNQDKKMEKLLAEIIDAFADSSDDIMYPPILDSSYLGEGFDEF